MRKPIAASLCALVLSGCTTIGVRTDASRASAASVTMSVRVLSSLSERQTNACLDKAKQELSSVGVNLETRVEPYERPPGMLLPAVMNDIALMPLGDDDRIFALLGGTPILIFGAVDNLTSTRGYARAGWSFSHVINFMPPCSAVVHEMWHLLGCGHGLTMNSCYDRIAEMKSAHKGGFLPARNLDTGELILDPAEADERLRRFVYGEDG